MGLHKAIGYDRTAVLTYDESVAFGQKIMTLRRIASEISDVVRHSDHPDSDSLVGVIAPAAGQVLRAESNENHTYRKEGLWHRTSTRQVYAYLPAECPSEAFALPLLEAVISEENTGRILGLEDGCAPGLAQLLSYTSGPKLVTVRQPISFIEGQSPNRRGRYNTRFLIIGDTHLDLLEGMADLKVSYTRVRY